MSPARRFHECLASARPLVGATGPSGSPSSRTRRQAALEWSKPRALRRRRASHRGECDRGDRNRAASRQPLEARPGLEGLVARVVEVMRKTGALSQSCQSQSRSARRNSRSSPEVLTGSEIDTGSASGRHQTQCEPRKLPGWQGEDNGRVVAASELCLNLLGGVLSWQCRWRATCICFPRDVGRGRRTLALGAPDVRHSRVSGRSTTTSQSRCRWLRPTASL